MIINYKINTNSKEDVVENGRKKAKPRNETEKKTWWGLYDGFVSDQQKLVKLTVFLNLNLNIFVIFS